MRISIRAVGGTARALLLGALLAGPAAAADAGEAKPAAPEPPVQISSDEAEYFNKEGVVVFSGKVVAVQGDSTLSAERMEVAFSQQENPEKTAGGLAGAASGRKITMITATKSVSFRQLDPETGKERYATGEKCVYDAQRRVVTMTGSPRLWEGKNVIDGEEMTFLLEEKKVLVKGSGERRVNLTVYPDEVKEAPAPR
jgi:lipopolysaccharide export system protein LptA